MHHHWFSMRTYPITLICMSEVDQICCLCCPSLTLQERSHNVSFVFLMSQNRSNRSIVSESPVAPVVCLKPCLLRIFAQSWFFAMSPLNGGPSHRSKKHAEHIIFALEAAKSVSLSASGPIWHLRRSWSRMLKTLRRMTTMTTTTLWTRATHRLQ